MVFHRSLQYLLIEASMIFRPYTIYLAPFRAPMQLLSSHLKDCRILADASFKGFSAVYIALPVGRIYAETNQLECDAKSEKLVQTFYVNFHKRKPIFTLPGHAKLALSLIQAPCNGVDVVLCIADGAFHSGNVAKYDSVVKH